MTLGASGWFVCLLVFAYNFMPGKFVDSSPNNESQVNSTAFVGAVVNFEPSWTKGSPKMEAIINAASFGRYAEQAAATGAEVVVFPEGAVRSTSGERVPVDIPPLGSNMCDSVSFPDQSQIMALLSCAAYSASLFLVASVDENVGNKVCSSQVVFDEDGTLVARHREYNCLGDDDDDDDQYFVLPPSEVKIGLLLAQDLVEFGIVNDLVSSGVIHYALSYNIKELFPFDTSLQTQLWWSFGRDVILMASSLTSNAENDRRSGIFGGRSNGRCLPMAGDQGLVVAEIPSQRGSPLHCRDVDWGAERDQPSLKRELRALGANKMASTSITKSTKKNGPHNPMKYWRISPRTDKSSKQSDDDYYYDYYDDFLENEKVTMKPVTHDMSGQWTKLCQFEFCCSFFIETTPNDNHPGYRLMVFSGPSLEFGPHVRVDRCGLVQCKECEGNDVSSFLVQSNRPGLTPNVLTDGKSASPRVRFTDEAHPKMIADQNVRSVVSAVLQTVEKESSSGDDEDDKVRTNPSFKFRQTDVKTSKTTSPTDQVMRNVASLQHDINSNIQFGVNVVRRNNYSPPWSFLK